MKRVLDVLFDGCYDNRRVSVYNTHTKYTKHECDGSITEVYAGEVSVRGLYGYV